VQAAGFSGGLLGSFLSQLPISDHACGGHDVTVEVSHKPEEAEAREGAKESHVAGTEPRSNQPGLRAKN
jgi:hypothetical protein